MSARAAPISTRAAPRTVLFVEDDIDYLEVLLRMARTPTVTTVGATTVAEALAIAARQHVDAAVTDLVLPDGTGIDFIMALRKGGRELPVLVLTGEGSVHAAVEALKQGASDFLQKPIDAPRLRGLLDELLADAASHGRGPPSDDHPDWFQGMYGRSASMRAVFEQIRRIAPTDAPVTIVGESGSGKELVARAIHEESARHGHAFVPVHTGAIPRDLVASELFGHERGAFTGALTATDGKFEAARRGSIFLDEVGTMGHDVQVALLRVLETLRFQRVGGHKELVADVRVIAATNRDLRAAVRAGGFREDLFFRLHVLTIELPPLRARRDDVVPLARHFLARFSERYAPTREPRRLGADAEERLLGYHFPGNVRELRNMMERAAVLVTGPEVHVRDLELDLDAPAVRPRVAAAETESDEAPLLSVRVGSTLEEVERALILRTLEHLGGNKQRAAQVLGISRRNLYYKLSQYGVESRLRK
ncbi:MAG: sigma-54-dependent Fis family transcriptional regulator [Myxococcales bacterium]|nr:sigma-54-dependent Fis family transcriptional regulator [Myxococcales bacterium]